MKSAEWVVRFRKAAGALVRAVHGGVDWLIGKLKAVPNSVYERILRWTGAVIAVLVILVFGLISFVIYYPDTQIPEMHPVVQIVYLDQGPGWEPSRDAENRQTYYYTPQGTSLKGLRYSWFVNLEQPFSKEMFSEPNHLRAYGFLVDMAATMKNPDQLPVGFAKRYDRNVRDYVLDITCSACHTGQINFLRDGQEWAIRIDGGAAMHAFTAAKYGHFAPMLLSSLAETYVNPIKFRRFARRVLGDESYKTGKDMLHEQVGGVLRLFLQQAWNDGVRHHLYPTEEGFGRTDAIARISNTVFAEHLSPDNYRVGNAPVSYPPVWDIWKFNWVQYAASVRQPLARNLGESMGVGSTYHLTDDFGRPVPPEERYVTTADVGGMQKIEAAITTLKPPPWPEEYLGAIDWCRARRGRSLFTQRCQPCHGPHRVDPYITSIASPGKVCQSGADPCIPNAAEAAAALPEWEVKMLDVLDIGTDPTAALNFTDVRVSLRKTGISEKELTRVLRPMYELDLKRRLADLDAGLKNWQVVLKARGIAPGSAEDKELRASFTEKLESAKTNGAAAISQALDAIDLDSVSIGGGLNYLGVLIRDVYFRDNPVSSVVRAKMEGYGALDLPQVLPVYKARPLAGIWATPPFLHNGSVPTIYELLGPADDRPKRFYVGRKLYDPVRVGYLQEPLSKGGFWFDTSVTGNHNTGHEFRAGYVPWQEGVPQYGVIGPALLEDEKMAIIEYLKVHSDDENIIDRRQKEQPEKFSSCAVQGRAK